MDKWLEDTVYERIQQSMVNAREDAQYKPLWEDLKQRSQEYQQVSQNCCDAVKQASDEYLSAVHACHDYEKQGAYLQGVRDCVELLRAIGLL